MLGSHKLQGLGSFPLGADVECARREPRRHGQHLRFAIKHWHTRCVRLSIREVAAQHTRWLAAAANTRRKCRRPKKSAAKTILLRTFLGFVVVYAVNHPSNCGRQHCRLR